MPRGGRLCIEAGTVTLDEAQAVKLAPDARAGQWLALGVRDSGTGIPPEVKARLFDPFFTTKPKGKGTGLGLATVLRLTRRHSGFVTLQTELGVGSCFTCHFPLKTPNTGAATPQGFVETNTAAKADVNA
jgi:signal transduction histidine kinase